MMANKAFALDKPAAQLPLIDFTSEDAPDAFFDSLKTFGFATLMSHPLDMARVGRIYSEWRAQFSQGDKFMTRIKRTRTNEAAHASSFCVS